MKSIAAADVSSSIVSIRFFVSAPVSSMVCLPTLPKRGSTGRIVLDRSPCSAARRAGRTWLGTRDPSDSPGSSGSSSALRW